MLSTTLNPFGAISSNLQHSMASNLVVSSRTAVPVVAVAFVVLCVTLRANAEPSDFQMNVPSPAVRFVPAQLSGHAPRTAAANVDRTFERYGPQATERAVRSSLKAALVPDPLAMGALIFCAFALRWIRMHRQHSRAKLQSMASPALPRAA